MAGLARDRGLLTLPADAPLTPGTDDQHIPLTQVRVLLVYYQDIVLPELRVLLVELSVLGLEREMRFNPLIVLPQHRGIHSLSQVCSKGKSCKNALFSEECRL